MRQVAGSCDHARAVTTRLVAERAGAWAGLAHYHFRSADDLLTDAALRMMRRPAGDVPADLLGDSATSITALLSLIGGYHEPSADGSVPDPEATAVVLRLHSRAHEGLAESARRDRACPPARRSTRCRWSGCGCGSPDARRPIRRRPADIP
nr:hypothetical protein [Nocardia cerradoensis]